MLDEEKILARANELYVEEKVGKHLVSIYKERGWPVPQIESNQVKCLLKALVEAFNARVQY